MSDSFHFSFAGPSNFLHPPPRFEHDILSTLTQSSLFPLKGDRHSERGFIYSSCYTDIPIRPYIALEIGVGIKDADQSKPERYLRERATSLKAKTGSFPLKLSAMAEVEKSFTKTNTMNIRNIAENPVFM